MPKKSYESPMEVNDEYSILVMTDGTTTIAEIYAPRVYGPDKTIGRGVAKRRKGDKRNNRVGEFLALKRAFESAAANASQTLARNGYGDD